ncbi:hypothetical protein ACFZAM_23545 [Streptomyces sp. NPDC008079]|uniref:hypothetical protein n=1 Tax=Streptomyces sp. NPDC008079 TaxID=3364806 RepID=UPI0036E367D1
MSQSVRAESGFAYGVVGADIHVFGDGVPVYLLQRWQPPVLPDDGFLLNVPSRMLNARFRVVEFTGRTAELTSLRRWRDGGGPLAVQWLCAPGGQGKTRLADRFAQESLAEGWQVVTATHGPGSVLPPPGSQDLRDRGDAGVLLIVDYADRWPLTHLMWLFGNALVHRDSGRGARVLLIARGDEVWPSVRAALANQQARTSLQRLAPLSDEVGGDGAAASPRSEMFAVARDSFAARYGVSPGGIAAPAPLGDAAFGLTLAVHMAALVAVDADAHGLRAPTDLAGLSSYLLDREQLHWARLYGDPDHEIAPSAPAFRTSPALMNRTVFTAALTGPVSPEEGRVAISDLAVRLPADRILADHAVCYPPAEADRDTVLEPLYPDRLAEDFLALTLPGHRADYPAQDWAGRTVSAMLSGTDVVSDAVTGSWMPRAVVFLTAAAQRWPHVGPLHLFPLLGTAPQLAVIGGSAALATLAALDDISPELLEAVAMFFPPFNRRSPDLDPGIAAVSTRLLPHRLERARNPNDQAAERHEHGVRLHHAGRLEEALAESEAVLAQFRAIARDGVPNPSLVPVVEGNLAFALKAYADRLGEVGRRAEALAATEEAVAVQRRLAAYDEQYRPDLASGLLGIGRDLSYAQRWDDATAALEESVTLLRALAAEEPGKHESNLSAALAALGVCHLRIDRPRSAVSHGRESVALRRRLHAKDPSAHAMSLANALYHLAAALERVGDPDSVPLAHEAVELYRDLARVNPAAYERELADGLNGLAVRLLVAQRPEESLTAAYESVAILRRVSAREAIAEQHTLAEALGVLLGALMVTGRFAEATDTADECVMVCRRMTEKDPLALHRLAGALLIAAEVRVTPADPRLDEALALFDEATEIMDLYAISPQGGPALHHRVGSRLIELLTAADRPAPAARLRRTLQNPTTP